MKIKRFYYNKYFRSVSLESLIILLYIIFVLIVIESICQIVIRFVNKEFPWLIIKKDEKPKLSKIGLEKFFKNGFDEKLGWVRKPNTNNEESGKLKLVKWSINEKGARTNPEYDNKKSNISCYGDSFTFARQVNDNETWEHELSKKTNSNVQNFGVGNYGVDQSLLRLKQEYNSNRTKYVILGVVPDSIRRNLNFWKHYFEYGNTFGFKPRFILSENKLKLIENPINEKIKFNEYDKFLEQIKKYDYFYKKKFLKEIITFPYSINILKNIKRNFSIIYWVMKIAWYKKRKMNTSEIEWKPMEKIMKINLDWRIKLFQNNEAVTIFKKIIEEFFNFSQKEKFIPIFVILPQKDDILFIKSHFNFYEKFFQDLKENEKLFTIDITNELLNQEELSELYTDDNEYGGHFSVEGNKKIAEIIYKKIQEIK